MAPGVTGSNRSIFSFSCLELELCPDLEYDRFSTSNGVSLGEGVKRRSVRVYLYFQVGDYWGSLHEDPNPDLKQAYVAWSHESLSRSESITF